MENIIWNKVTGLSQIVAIVLFVVVFGVGFYLGVKYAKSNANEDIFSNFVPESTYTQQ